MKISILATLLTLLFWHSAALSADPEAFLKSIAAYNKLDTDYKISSNGNNLSLVGKKSNSEFQVYTVDKLTNTKNMTSCKYNSVKSREARSKSYYDCLTLSQELCDAFDSKTPMTEFMESKAGKVHKEIANDNIDRIKGISILNRLYTYTDLIDKNSKSLCELYHISPPNKATTPPPKAKSAI